MASKFAKSLAIAVDVGGTKLRTALVGRKGKIVRKNVVETARKGKNGLVITGQIINEVEKILAGIPAGKIAGIGVSAAGPQDRKKGVVINAPNMAFKLILIVEPLKRKFRMPVELINDGAAGVLGEKYFGKYKGCENIVYITISSGIGGGAVTDGRLLLGKDGSAAEIGHIIVDTKYNLSCSCRKGRGHWEAYASGNNIPRFFRAWAKKKKKGKINFNHRKAADIFAAARKKDRVALKFMEELGRINGRGLSNVIAAYDPELIVFGGAVALNNGDLVLKYAKKYIDEFLRRPKLKISPLGESVPLLGAAALIFGYPHSSS